MDFDKTPQYRSSWSTFQYLTRTHGLSVLWAGLGPRAVRIVGATFILLAVRTQCVEFLEGRAAGDVSDPPDRIFNQ